MSAGNEQISVCSLLISQSVLSGWDELFCGIICPNYHEPTCGADSLFRKGAKPNNFHHFILIRMAILQHYKCREEILPQKTVTRWQNECEAEELGSTLSATCLPTWIYLVEGEQCIKIALRWPLVLSSFNWICTILSMVATSKCQKNIWSIWSMGVSLTIDNERSINRLKFNQTFPRKFQNCLEDVAHGANVMQCLQRMKHGTQPNM